MTWGASDVTVRFGRRVALDGVSLEAPPGQVTAVVGGDGAGKTTLLRALVGALAVDGGEVHRPDATRIGYQASTSGTYADLTVDESIDFVATAYGVARSRARERAAEHLERTGLASARDRLAGRLSGGMRRKLGVILALLHQPELVVLDEPTTGVDPVSRADLWWLVARAAADGAAVVLSSTYLDEAERAARLLVLDQGRTLATGSADEIVDALPGRITTSPSAPASEDRERAWRRGPTWRLWHPEVRTGRPHAPVPAAAGDSAAPDGFRPDLQDVVTALALARHTDGPTPAPVTGSVSPGEALVVARRVSRRFGRFVAVDGADLEVRPGEVVGLLGANGAGKTTLIRMLLGLLHPTAGDVTLFGEPPSRRTRQRLGYLPQGLGLYDDLTPAENLAFARAVFGPRRDGRPSAGDDAPPAGVGSVGDVPDLPVGQLPLGAQRRVAFAEALDHRPDLLVLDEPTSGVDPLGRARLWETVHTAADQGMGVLVTTHYMDEATECDRLVVMAAGRVVAAGTVDDIVGRATVVTVRPPPPPPGRRRRTSGAGRHAADAVAVAGPDDSRAEPGEERHPSTVGGEPWSQAFVALNEAGMAAALVGRTLRIPGAAAEDVEQAVAGLPVEVAEAPATLEERFFELATAGTPEPAR